MARPYIKLDYDWRDDPKVMLYEQRHKKAALVDLVTVFILAADFGGYIDTRNEGHMLKACAALRKTRARMGAKRDSHQRPVRARC